MIDGDMVAHRSGSQVNKMFQKDFWKATERQVVAELAKAPRIMLNIELFRADAAAPCC